ncbi:hypothetical protein NLJ89_g11115 [Agrocybe chaxingu]|uniref:non-specific serine/threonine protein kinase n=1 Tax=Agrocybe chaxingu TaxID=84603 RepID=A0A9W8JWW2_9AGAR|nr:hypothetical protein NLJ89_g11115 [Agrocybe chaxingu]
MRAVGRLIARAATAFTKEPRAPSHLHLEPKRILNSRYEILKQIGSGQHSTVWLAEEYATLRKVAVKVLSDYVTSLQGVHAFELDVLKKIALNQTATHEKRLLHLYDHFLARGDHGHHLCLVSQPLGPSVLDIRSRTPNGALPIPLVQHITRQLLEGLEILHEKCKTVHTDIKFDNILFASHAESPDTNAYCAIDTVLIDFGTAMPEGTDHDRLIQPEALRSPEVLLGCTWDVNADIWNVGCIVFELLTGQRLFKPRAGASWSSEQYHMARIYSTLLDDNDRGRLIEFFRHGAKFTTFFDGDSLRVKATERESIQGILQHYGIYTQELDEFLVAMLRIHPNDRLSARQLLLLPWLRI